MYGKLHSCDRLLGWQQLQDGHSITALQIYSNKTSHGSGQDVCPILSGIVER